MSKRKKPNKHLNQKTVQKKTAQQAIKEPAGLLVATAREYHMRYAADIAYEIEFHKHLSVLMPAMIGLDPLPINLYDGLDFRCREYIIVEKQEDINALNDLLISQQDENKCIYPILFEDFLERHPEGGCYVLFDLSQAKRMKLTPILSSNKEVVVISIGRLKPETMDAKSSMVNQAQDVMAELYQITMKDGKPHCMVFPVESVLDIRDLAHASSSERTKLVSALYEICSDYEIDYGIPDQLTNAQGSAAKLAQYKKLLAERDYEISILKSVATSAGADLSNLEKSISKITKMKQAFADQFDQTIDPLEQEKLEAAFQNEVSELLVSITSNLMTVASKENYESMVIDQLGSDIWKKQLSERSRNYLISAMMTFDSMNKLPDRNALDYSGVCLQVTKVLDEEMTARFYTRYKQYLYKHFLLDYWPRAMKSRDEDEPLEANSFTIGTIAYVIGVGIQGRIYDSTAFEQVQAFAKTCLYKDGMSIKEIQDHLIQCVECAEKTRKDYRNPAAHREAMPYISARECIDYLIEQTKMLKLILQDMKV